VTTTPGRLRSASAPETEDPPENAARIDAPPRSFEGAGVSLALTHRFCALLGGRVEVESEAGAGSRFTLHLPATPP